MKNITLEELLEAGSHFGHQVTRQNPKARDFIFEARDNIHIIDLAKTKEGLDEAAQFVLQTSKKPETTILIVGTKRQAQPIVEELLKDMPNDSGIFYVIRHWVGGTITNFEKVQKNFEKLNKLTENLQNEDLRSKYTKKEMGLWDKERQKLEYFYSGIKNMKKLPDVVFAIDTHQEDLVVREARRMGIPVVGIVDTNADPEVVDYVIPANDDAVGSLKLIVGHILEAWKEGKIVKNDEVPMISDKEEKKELKKETKKSKYPKQPKETKKTEKKSK